MRLPFRLGFRLFGICPIIDEAQMGFLPRAPMVDKLEMGRVYGPMSAGARTTMIDACAGLVGAFEKEILTVAPFPCAAI